MGATLWEKGGKRRRTRRQRAAGGSRGRGRGGRVAERAAAICFAGCDRRGVGGGERCLDDRRAFGAGALEAGDGRRLGDDGEGLTAKGSLSQGLLFPGRLVSRNCLEAGGRGGGADGPE
ncbi:hypothetical protein Tco_1456753 [Tanacetum coccineum]|uniref:Uncharacterized protein n=1 Tax=Tanacetum coccineum TaxID=301880 RepID=A0ABQ5ASK5_9ASTR